MLCDAEGTGTKESDMQKVSKTVSDRTNEHPEHDCGKRRETKGGTRTQEKASSNKQVDNSNAREP